MFMRVFAGTLHNLKRHLASLDLRHLLQELSPLLVLIPVVDSECLCLLSYL